MGALQFQDITSQQLSHASAVLIEMENRMLDVAKLFDQNAAHVGFLTDGPLGAPDHATYDPNATTLNAETRQALADEIFTPLRAPAA
jgi:hypothetical protein